MSAYGADREARGRPPQARMAQLSDEREEVGTVSAAIQIGPGGGPPAVIEMKSYVICLSAEMWLFLYTIDC